MNPEKGVALTGLVPHPPLLIPRVGGKQIEQVLQTKEAVTQLAQAVVNVKPDVIVVISPHGPVFQDGIVVNFAPTVEGDFANFGAPEEKLQFIVDGLFAGAVQDEAEELEVPIIPLTIDLVKRFRLTTGLDHGSLVPLYYLKKAGWNGKIVPVTMGILPSDKLYSFGIAVQRAAQNLGRRVVVIASGDLSHRLTPDAPNGFNPRGQEFDSAITQALEAGDVANLLGITPELREEAGECGYRPLVMMAGAVDGYTLEPSLLSYEGPFGVGYGVALWKTVGVDASRRYLAGLQQQRQTYLAQVRQQESPLVRLARAAAELYVEQQEILSPIPDLPNNLPQQAGVFVTVKQAGNLRGCIGTFLPTQPSLAQEVIANAIQAVSNDPRFEPVDREELAELEYSVDVLSEPREVQDLSQHDPKVHGIIVAKGERRGLLLPDLEGVDTTEEQIAIAKRKAGIRPDDDDVALAQFEVTRYQ